MYVTVALVVLAAIVLYFLIKSRVSSSSSTVLMVLSKYWNEIKSVAATFNVDPETLAAQVVQESHGDPNIVGLAGERGLMQVTQAALTDVNLFYHYSLSLADLATPVNGLVAGAGYLRLKLNHTAGEREALAAYNAGEGNIKAGFHYADDVLAIKQQIHTLIMNGAF